MNRGADERKAGSREKRKQRATWRKFWFNVNKNSHHVVGSKEDSMFCDPKCRGVRKGISTYRVEVNVGSSLM